MPRLTAAAPKYRHHKASDQAVVTIAGKDHYLGPWKSKASKLEYDRLIGEWLVAGRPLAPIGQPHQVTVMEIAAAFWRFATAYYRKNGRSTGTAENYKPALSLLKRRYGHTPAAEFGPALKALRQVMIEDDQSRRYANENVHRIRKVFRWAASEQLIPVPVTDQGHGLLERFILGDAAAGESRITGEASTPWTSPSSPNAVLGGRGRGNLLVKLAPRGSDGV